MRLRPLDSSRQKSCLFRTSPHGFCSKCIIRTFFGFSTFAKINVTVPCLLVRISSDCFTSSSQKTLCQHQTHHLLNTSSARSHMTGPYVQTISQTYAQSRSPPLSSHHAFVLGHRITSRRNGGRRDLYLGLGTGEPYSFNSETHRKRCARRQRHRPTAVLAANPGSEAKPGSKGSVEHSEQRSGFQPPPPVEDDGHVVDMSSLQDLVDSGEGKHATRALTTHTWRCNAAAERLPC